MRSVVPIRPWELVAIAGLLTVGAVLRVWHLELGWFGVDQARDIQTALDVVAGRDLPTVGPTMRRLTSLGALYCYVWALPNLVSRDPLAAYRFAAALGVATAIGVWAFARRAWGARAALVALAAFATAPIAVIDGRVAWSPAAVPPMALLLLWLLAGPATTFRIGALGAALGVAVQLHLALVAWVVVAVGLVLARRPGVRPIVVGALAGVATGLPALYAVATNAGRDLGIATLPSRGPLPNLAHRLIAAWALEWRVPPAFARWTTDPEPWPAVTRAAAVVIALAAALGIGRLVGMLFRRDWTATVVVVAFVVQLAMVAVLPGDAWYYYLDPLLPLSALAAGALVAETARPASVVPRAGLASAVALTVIVAAGVLGGRDAWWLATASRHGYLAVDPAVLTLDGTGGRDASAPGRLLSAGVKREVAAVLGREPATFAERWLAVHGPAFDDVTGDNGFWLARTASATTTVPLRHAVVWFRDDPGAPAEPTAGFELLDVGPLRLVRYTPAIAYETCRDARGPIAVPLRVLPAPRRYGDGTIARRSELPPRIDCMLRPGRGGVRVVAAATSGTLALRAATDRDGPVGATSTLCVVRGDAPTPFTIEVALPAGQASDLDLYERPDPDCAAKIAP